MDIFDCNDPLIINPTISAKIGLHESIVLRQIHYWLELNKRDNRNFHDGFHWTFNSYPKWQEQFPFWSIPTIQRLFAKLEKDGLLISGKYNKLKMDRTKWYRINYDKLQTLINQPSYQSDTMEHINLIRPSPQLDTMDNIEMIRPIPETNSENTAEISEETNTVLLCSNFLSVFEYLRGKYSIEYKRIYGVEPEFKHLMTLQEFVRHYVEKNSPNEIELNKIIAKHFESGSHSVTRFFSELGRVS